MTEESGMGPEDGIVTGIPGEETIVEKELEVGEPSRYKVLLHNDDYTPMDFVVNVLRRFFRHGPDEATRIMFRVHNAGVGVAGVFPREIAETKVHQVATYARKHLHPLKCTMEKE
jgi:ATP-dependent Clp protease adaptor protein ClpS